VVEIGVAVSRDSRTPIEAALGDGRRLGVKARYIEQPTPLGLGHAVGCGREFVGEETFAVYLGDTILPEGLGALRRSFRQGDAAALLLKPVEDPRGFGIATLDGERVTRLVEKPREHIGNLAAAGAYIFTPAIFAAIEQLRPSWRGEYEISDAIQFLIDRGGTVRACCSRGWWKDTGRPEDVLEANRVLLDALKPAVAGTVDADSRIEGTVEIAPGAVIRAAVVRGPAIIGAGALVERSTVGPYLALGDRARVVGSEIRDSIVMEEAVIEGVARPLAGCMIGKGAQVRGAAEARLILGDAGRVEI
jgi:glucose-1-phosphate thymidylyltransferase